MFLSDFKKAGWNVISRSSLFPVSFHFLIADAAVLKEITTHRTKYMKPVEEYEVLSLFGKVSLYLIKDNLALLSMRNMSAHRYN